MNKHTQQEIEKFDALADDFWDREGAFKTLHQINPIRVGFVEELIPLAGSKVADIGCGGGILSEALSAKAAQVTAIDLSSVGIKAAKAQQQYSGSDVDYRLQSTQDLAAEVASSQKYFDAVICMEMLEHVDNPAAIVSDCAAMTKPDGIVVFSTLNRTLKAHLLAVIMAEYVLRMVPQGTHNHKAFIKPSEMQNMAAAAGLLPVDIIGFEYRLLQRDFIRSRNTDINYIFAFRKQQQTP